MGFLLQTFFFKYLRKLNTLINWFYLYSNKFVFNFYKEVNIVKSVPFIRCWFYFYSNLFLKLSINCFDFSSITIKSSINNELNHIINTILLCYFFYFSLYDFRDFYIEFLTKAFNMFF